MLTFDPVAHEYFWCGKPVPGVTTLLKPLYDFSHVSDEDMEAACYRGTAVHLACELYDLGTLDESALDPAWRPYLDAWVKYREERNFNPIMTERQVFHPVLKYAGTLDRFGMFGSIESTRSIVDIKTSASLSPAIGAQLAAYEEALKAGDNLKLTHKLGRFAVQLKADGSYKVQEYKDSTDWSAFVGLLNVHNWCAKHQIKENYHG